MSKKIDINKVLSTGSAKQRAVLLFYHYNLKEAMDKGVNVFNQKLPLTDKEATELFNSFKDKKDIKVYNDYRALNIEVIQAMRWLLQLKRTFQAEYWEYNALYLQNKYVFTGDKYLKEVEYTDGLDEYVLIYNYSTALEYYTALKIYIKESGYRDKFVIGSIDLMYKAIRGNWAYPVLIGGKEIIQSLSDVEPDEKGVKDLLKIEFNLEYETEE
jgi:archaellin